MATAVVAGAAERRVDAESEENPARIGLVVIAIAVGAALAVWLPQLDATFGLGHIGSGSATWATGARAVVENGWIESALGGRMVGRDYASHPPGLVILLSGITSVIGEHEWAIRSLAIAGTLCAIPAMVVLARRAGFDRRSAYLAGATVLALPMMSTFGVRLDTWQIGLPIGIMALARHGQRGGARWAFGAAMFSWQGLILAVFLAGAEIRRRRPGTAVAVAAAFGLTVAWAWWVDGGASLLERGGDRVGTGRVASLVQQAEWLAFLIGPIAVLAIVGVVLVPRVRPWVAVTTAAVVVWTVAFPSGAIVHEFWAMWLVIPVALGVGAAAHHKEALAAVATFTVAMTAAGGLLVETHDEEKERSSSIVVDQLRASGDLLDVYGYSGTAEFYNIPQPSPPADE